MIPREQTKVKIEPTTGFRHAAVIVDPRPLTASARTMRNPKADTAIEKGRANPDCLHLLMPALLEECL